MAEILPLVLVPGLTCSARLWAPQIEALWPFGPVMVADHRRDASMDGIAKRILSSAPPRFALAGLSMGGYIALEVVRQAPERVARLALLDTSARADSPEQAQKRRDFIDLAERGRFLGVTDALLPLLLHPSHLGDASLVATVKAMAKTVGKEAFIRQERAIMGRPDSRPLLAQIRCPTLVACGRQDALTPLDRHEEIAAAVPGARLEVIADCGHLSTLEQPQAVNAALARWLDACVET